MGHCIWDDRVPAPGPVDNLGPYLPHPIPKNPSAKLLAMLPKYSPCQSIMSQTFLCLQIQMEYKDEVLGRTNWPVPNFATLPARLEQFAKTSLKHFMDNVIILVNCPAWIHLVDILQANNIPFAKFCVLADKSSTSLMSISELLNMYS